MISFYLESEASAIIAFKRYIRAAASRQFDTQSLDTSDVNEFLVIRLPQSAESSTTTATSSAETAQPMETDDIPALEAISQATNHIVDEEILPIAPPVLPPPARNQQPQEPLPSIVVGSAGWHNGLPTTWLPVITQDIGRQRRAVSTKYFHSNNKIQIFLFRRQLRDHFRMPIYRECHRNVVN